MAIRQMMMTQNVTKSSLATPVRDLIVNMALLRIAFLVVVSTVAVLVPAFGQSSITRSGGFVWLDNNTRSALEDLALRPDSDFDLSQGTRIYAVRGFRGSAGELPKLCGFRHGVAFGLWKASPDGHCYASDAQESSNAQPPNLEKLIQQFKNNKGKIVGSYWHD